MRKAAIIAQSVDPSRGSEFATGWGMIREIYCDPRVLAAFDVDIFISLNENNRDAIHAELAGLESKPNIVFVPQIFPQMHRYLGRFLRLAWQFNLGRQLSREGYYLIHQVSPNSIAYLNPIFFRKGQEVRLVGPMRAGTSASVPGVYWYDTHVLCRHISIHIKEGLERVLFYAHRWVIRNRIVLHLEPISGHSKQRNQIYCPETLFVQIPSQPENDTTSGEIGWTIIWSGAGDIDRKNEDLARRVITAALVDSRLDNLHFEMIGTRGPITLGQRVVRLAPLARDEFLDRLGDRTIYLLTSLLELNSVLAEEVMRRSGQVIAGPLPAFVGRESEPQIHIVDRYGDPRAWVEALVQAVGKSPVRSLERKNFMQSKKEEIVKNLVALADNI